MVWYSVVLRSLYTVRYTFSGLSRWRAKEWSHINMGLAFIRYESQIDLIYKKINILLKRSNRAPCLLWGQWFTREVRTHTLQHYDYSHLSPNLAMVLLTLHISTSLWIHQYGLRGDVSQVKYHRIKEIGQKMSLDLLVLWSWHHVSLLIKRSALLVTI